MVGIWRRNCVILVENNMLEPSDRAQCLPIDRTNIFNDYVRDAKGRISQDPKCHNEGREVQRLHSFSLSFCINETSLL